MPCTDPRSPWRRLAQAASLLLVLLPAACAPGAPAPSAPAEARAGAERGPDAAMRRFVDALLAKDTEALATLFPREGRWTYLGTLTDPPLSSTHSGAELARDLAARRGLYGSLIEDADLDTFRDHAARTQGRDWVRVGETRYAPPDMAGAEPRVFVAWRREAGRWVVDAIAEPAA
jgi:hypothetical protein